MEVEELKPTRKRNIFISFIEEFWSGQLENTILGRIEVTYPGDRLFSSEEIRISCFESQAFSRFRKTWDFKYVSLKELSIVRRRLEKFNYELLSRF